MLPRPRRALAGAAVVAWLTVAAIALWHWGVVAQWHPWRTEFGTADLDGYFYPKWVYGAAALARGRIPLWNPLEFCGMPFLATAQVAALYPVKNIVFWALPAPAALQVNTVLHLILAGAFEYAYVRWLGLAPGAALVGAVAWGFNPYFLDSLYHVNRITCLTWVPLALLCYERAARRRTVGAAALAGVVLAVQASAGYPGFTLGMMLVLGVWTAAWLWRPQERGPSRRAALAVAAGVALFTFAFAAPQLLPLQEMLGETTRTDLVTSWTTQFESRRIGAAEITWTALGIVQSLTVGPVAVLALSGLVFGRGRPRWVLLAGLVTCVSAGRGFAPLVRLIPGMSDMRALWLLFDGFVPFFVATLAAIGVERLLARDGSPRRVAALLFGPAIVTGLVWWSVVRMVASSDGALARGFVQGALGMWWQIALAGLVGAVLMLARRLGAREAVMGPAIACILVLSAFARVWSRGEMNSYPVAQIEPLLPPWFHAVAPAGRAFSTKLALDGSLLLGGIPNVWGQEGSLHPRRVGRLLDTAGIGGIAVNLQMAAQTQPVLDLMGLSVMIGGTPRATLSTLGFVQVMHLGKDRIVSWRHEAAGRVVAVNTGRGVTSEEEAFKAVTDPAFRPQDEAIVEGELPPLEAGPTRSSAALVVDEPEHLTIVANMSGAGLVVLADAWFPGWDAWVDGRPVPILRAQYAFRAVAVPDGRHTIEFRYRPRSFWFGVALAAGAAALAVAFRATPGRHTRAPSRYSDASR